MFQFEIGVQSTLDATLRAIDRPAALARLEATVHRLAATGRIRLHLDLVAGLPGEGFADFLASIDRVAALAPDHLQVEPVKLLPGTPLRDQAGALGLRFDPNPPYTVLATPELDFAELDRLRTISRLLDLTCNAGCFPTFLATLAAAVGSLCPRPGTSRHRPGRPRLAALSVEPHRPVHQARRGGRTAMAGDRAAA